MPPPPNLDVLRLQIQFPGMPRPESDVFRFWLELHGAEYDQIEFNVRLGTGVDPGPIVDDATRAMAIGLTQKRADVVATRDGQPTIIEVKVRIGLGTIGQLLGYQTLWMRDRPESPTPALLAIARRTDDDTLDALRAHGIDVALYEEAE
jgi:hypothetical protein